MNHPLQSPNREIASILNPLISALWTEETLDNVSAVITDLGFFISLCEEDISGNEPRFGQMWRLLGTCAAALNYESANGRFITRDRQPVELGEQALPD